MPATARSPSVEDVLASPVVADPLRQLDICATSDGAAALIVASKSFAEKHLGSLDGVPSVRAVSTVTPRYPQHLPELPDIATDSTAVVPAPDRVFKDQILDAAYAEAGIGPEDVSLAEVYDLSTALELDWYEHLGLCAKGEAEELLRSGATTIGGRVPVNAVGRAGLLRRGHPRPGDRAGLRADLAARSGNAIGPCHGRRQPPLSGTHLGATRACSAHGSSVSVVDASAGFKARQATTEVGSANAVVRQQISGRRRSGDSVPGLQDVGAVGAAQRLLRILLDQQHGGAFGVDLGDDLEDLRDHHRRQAHRRLVEQQHLGPGHQRPADGQHLLLAPGQRAADLGAAFGQPREGFEHPVELLAGARPCWEISFRSNPFQGSR